MLVGLIDTEQLDVVALTTARVQGVPVNEPDAVPVFVNATVPAGADGVPTPAVSLTNDVHVTSCPVPTDDGTHVTVWLIDLRLTVTVLLVPVLPL